MSSIKTFKETAKYQNMSVERVKAIAILEMIEEKTNYRFNPHGEKWYEFEDAIADVITGR